MVTWNNGYSPAPKAFTILTNEPFGINKARDFRILCILLDLIV